MDEDIGADKELGIASVPLHDLKPDTEIEITQKLLKSLDTAKVKDKSDRGSITISVSAIVQIIPSFCPFRLTCGFLLPCISSCNNYSSK